MSMDGQDRNDLTEFEANQVAGGTGKFINRGAGMPESRAVVSANISNKHQGKSNQGFYEKATRIVNKIFNDADVRNVLVPVLATVGVPVLGAGTIYLTGRIVQRISEAETPEAVLKNTAKTIREILDSQETKETNEKRVLTALTSCLLTLINFVPEEQQSALISTLNSKFGTQTKPKKFNKWEELQNAFTEVLGAINDKLTMKPEYDLLPELFANRKTDLTDVFDSKEKPRKEEPKKEEPKKEEKIDENENSVLLPQIENIFDSNYDVNMVHKSYTTEELKDNDVVSTETDINKDVLDIVDNMVTGSPTNQMKHYDLTNDVMLAVCKRMTISSKTLVEPLKNIIQANPKKNLYLVLQDCSVRFTNLRNINVKVLDLRGTTGFDAELWGMASVDKVLMRNHPTSKTQLHLATCDKVGQVYSLSEGKIRLMQSKLYLYWCTLCQDFKFVNLNKCCKKLLQKYCMNACECPSNSRDKILGYFEPESQPDEERLRGV